MTRAVRRTAGTMLAAATLAMLVGCAGAGAAVEDATDGTDSLAAGDTPEDVNDRNVPDECLDAFPLAFEPADIADLALQPSDWPAPPAGATLCLTAEALGGGNETASYATDAAIADVFAHYEAELSGYEIVRADGAQTGTGYATLDGAGPDVVFQVREADGGFVLVFGPAEQTG